MAPNLQGVIGHTVDWNLMGLDMVIESKLL